MPSFADISFPIGVVLIPFALFAVFYAGYGFFNIYNLLRYGVAGAALKGFTALYGIGSLFLLGLVLAALLRYDLTYTVSLSSFDGFFSIRPPGL